MIFRYGRNDESCLPRLGETQAGYEKMGVP
jgi:hypothetical protein